MKLVIHPAVEPERLAKIVEAARPMVVVNAGDEAEARAAIVDADAFFGKLTPGLLAAGAAAPLGAGAHGEPRALHVPGARGAPVPAHEHARALLGRDRRPRVRLRPLLRAELSSLHPEPARGALGARRRQGGEPRPRPAGRRSAVSSRRGRARRSRRASSRAPPRSAASTDRISTWRMPPSASSDSGRSARRSPGAGSPSGCGSWPSTRSRRRRRRGWRRSGAWTGCPTSSARATSW